MSSAIDSSNPVLFQEWPYAYVVVDSCVEEYCHYCLKTKKEDRDRLPLCSDCKFARYCDATCQKNARNDHRKECRHLKQVDFVPSYHARLIARIVFKRDKEYQPDDNLHPLLKSRRFSELMNHEAELKRGAWQMESFHLINGELQKYLGKAYTSFDDVFDIYAKIFTNAFGITVQDIEGMVAKGLYIGMSVMDHSCDPDCFGQFNGPTMIMRALKNDLEAKSPKELTICYIETFKPTCERQRLCSKQYYFSCKCPFCLDESRDALMRSIICKHCSGMALLITEKQTTTCPECKQETDLAASSVTFDVKRNQVVAMCIIAHCSGLAVLSAEIINATCQSCTKRMDATSALKLMEHIEYTFYIEDSDPSVNLKEEFAVLNTQAHSMLSEANVYSSRLAMKMVEQLQASGQSLLALDPYVERSLKGLEKFALPYDRQTFDYKLSYGAICSKNRSRRKDGLRLFKEALKGFLFLNFRNNAEVCREQLKKYGATEEG